MNPGVHWWLKGDGTDVVKGLWQSTSGEWAGDVDLNDGRLQRQYSDFKIRMEEVKNLGVGRIKRDFESRNPFYQNQFNICV